MITQLLEINGSAQGTGSGERTAAIFLDLNEYDRLPS